MKNYITNSLNRLGTNDESGHAMLEFAIIAPFMIFVCLLGTIEIGMLIQEHQKLTGIVAAAARTSSNYPGLFDSGVGIAQETYGCTADPATYSPGSSGLVKGAHAPLHSRICNILFQMGYEDIAGDNEFIITTTPNDKVACAACSPQRDLEISIQVPYSGILSSFLPKDMNLEVVRVAPYMKPVS